MARIRWSVKAADDLWAIEDYIARDSPLHAVNFIDRLVLSVQRLKLFPRMGRIVPEFEREDIRECIFRPYRIVYHLDADDITILRVIHGARDLKGLIAREPWELD